MIDLKAERRDVTAFELSYTHLTIIYVVPVDVLKCIDLFGFGPYLNVIFSRSFGWGNVMFSPSVFVLRRFYLRYNISDTNICQDL